MTTTNAMKLFLLLLVPWLGLLESSCAFQNNPRHIKRRSTFRFASGGRDFDDDAESKDDESILASFSSVVRGRQASSSSSSWSQGEQQPQDRSCVQTRQFVVGDDLQLSDYAGSMGFDEVTDWEYYRPDGDDGSERRVVKPNPFDSEMPRRTRESSGSVVRIFRGQFAGLLGALLRSKGLDRRVLIKEFSGRAALNLARNELQAIGTLQSKIPQKDDDWTKAASSRSEMFRIDNTNVCTLVQRLSKAPFLGILGVVNLTDLLSDLDPNAFYRALRVGPPKPFSVWIVYEYAGLTTLRAYCQPAIIRRSKMPPKRGLLGMVAPPPVPPFTERAAFVKSIMKQALESVASLHDAGLMHRSVGRSSLLLSSPGQDKLVGSNVYTTSPSQLLVKLADFGFSSALQDVDEDAARRARTFGLSLDSRGETKLFGIAEDLHALAFVFAGLLLTALAEVPSISYSMRPTDEDSIQRLLTDICDKDMGKFRAYVETEEVWAELVGWLDDRRGWDLLESLWLARERLASGNPETARDILRTSPFLS